MLLLNHDNGTSPSLPVVPNTPECKQKKVETSTATSDQSKHVLDANPMISVSVTSKQSRSHCQELLSF